MTYFIEDGTGCGYRAKVGSNNMLGVHSISEGHKAYVSKTDGQAYSWSNATYDYSAGDTIILLKNTSPSKYLTIEDIYLGSDSATLATIHFPTCNSPSGTSITGVNHNRLSGNIANSYCYSNETTNSQGPIYCNLFLESSKTYRVHTNDSIVLAQGNCIAVDFVSDGGAAYVSIIGFFHDMEE